MTSQLADRAAGAMQGVADAAQGVTHEARGGRDLCCLRELSDRADATYGRWQAGLPARNTYERDAYASIEANLAAGMNRLNQAAKTQAGRSAEAEPEAGG
jgi:hypothetical protein